MKLCKKGTVPRLCRKDTVEVRIQCHPQTFYSPPDSLCSNYPRKERDQSHISGITSCLRGRIPCTLGGTLCIYPLARFLSFLWGTEPSIGCRIRTGDHRRRMRCSAPACVRRKWHTGRHTARIHHTLACRREWCQSRILQCIYRLAEEEIPNIRRTSSTHQLQCICRIHPGSSYTCGWRTRRHHPGTLDHKGST